MIGIFSYSRLYHVCLITFLITLLSACGAITAPEEAPTVKRSWKEREVLLNQIHAWQLNGKIAVQTPKDSGSANMDWTQSNQHFHLSLYGPLGSNNVTISGNPGHAKLETADGKQRIANSPEQLLSQQLGWRLPLSSLIYWVRGLPAPGTPYQSHMDQNHRLRQLIQQGCRIEFLSYRNSGTIDLPNKIFITATHLKTKMIIYSWKL